MKDIAIYMSGSIKKGDEDTRDAFWSEEHFREIVSRLGGVSSVTFLNPGKRSDDLSDFEGTFGRDMLQVVLADFVWVDARKKRGLGVGSEMTVAKYHGIPVLSWCPNNSHYWRSDFKFMEQQLDEWVHPFIHGLSDVIVESLQEGCDWIEDAISSSSASLGASATGMERIPKAVKHYIDHQLSRDTEMRQMVESCPVLTAKLARWR